MKLEHEIDKHDHVIVYIWGTSGGGGRGFGHAAAKIHNADFNEDIFVSLWPGNDEKETLLTWQRDFNEAFKAERNHGPTTVLVFYTLDILSMQGRLDTLKLQTESWVIMPTKKESLDSASAHHNCCTAVWTVLKAGNLYGSDGILSEAEFKSVLTTAKFNLPVKGASQLPQSISKVIGASSQGKGSNTTTMVGSGPSTLTLEALLGGERYGPDILYEILTKAKKKEVEKMVENDPHDVRLALRFNGHNNLKRYDGTMHNEDNVGAETEMFSAATLINAKQPKRK